MTQENDTLRTALLETEKKLAEVEERLIPLVGLEQQKWDLRTLSSGLRRVLNLSMPILHSEKTRILSELVKELLEKENISCYDSQLCWGCGQPRQFPPSDLWNQNGGECDVTCLLRRFREALMLLAI